MAADIVDLIPSLRAALNVPGSATPLFNFDDEEPWIDALGAAFWTVQSRGRAIKLWIDFRVTVEGDQIVNIMDTAITLERVDQQLVVLQAAMSAIETLLLSLPTRTHAKAGPVESDLERSSTVLRQLLLDKRAELEGALKELGAGAGATSVIPRVVDGMLARSACYGATPYFVN